MAAIRVNCRKAANQTLATGQDHGQNPSCCARSDHPGKAAEFYKSAFGFKELSRFGLDPDKPDEAPRPSGVFLTDGTLNIAILKFPTDQLGKGIGFTGIHHFGVVVDDTEAWTQKA